MINLDLIHNYSYLGGVIYASSSRRTKPASFFVKKRLKNLKFGLKKDRKFYEKVKKNLNIRKYLLKKNGRPIASENLRKVKPNGFTAFWLEKFGESDPHMA
jgi:hypothetical protein